MDKRGSVGEIVDLAIRVEGGASKIFEHADGTRNVVCDGVGDRFAVVECLQHRIIEKAFPDALCDGTQHHLRSEEHTSELQSLMRTSYAVFCLKKKKCQTNRSDIVKI